MPRRSPPRAPRPRSAGRWRTAASPSGARCGRGGEPRQCGLRLGAIRVGDETAAAVELVMDPCAERRQPRARHARQDDPRNLGDAGERQAVRAGDEEPARGGEGVGAEGDPDLVGGRGGDGRDGLEAGARRDRAGCAGCNDREQQGEPGRGPPAPRLRCPGKDGTGARALEHPPTIALFRTRSGRAARPASPRFRRLGVSGASLRRSV